MGSVTTNASSGEAPRQVARQAEDHNPAEVTFGRWLRDDRVA
jgi:hypothetical protein